MKSNQKSVPAHIVAAAKAAAAKAPDFTPDLLAEAYRAIGVEDNSVRVQKNARKKSAA